MISIHDLPDSKEQPKHSALDWEATFKDLRLHQMPLQVWLSYWKGLYR